MSNHKNKQQLIDAWKNEPRWRGIKRAYKAEDVVKLRGSIRVSHTLATLGAERMWKLLEERKGVYALGAVTGNQAVQQVQAGLNSIYVSGWQVAADANTWGQTYPDQSLYPVDSVPCLVKRINSALLRADQIQTAEEGTQGNWLVPIIADAEAGFGGNLNAFELMKAMIESGAAAVHFEDQLSSAKKCGHMGGKVLVATQEAVQKLSAARLAADVLDVPTLIIARTDALSAKLVTSNFDEVDKKFIAGERTPDGFFVYKGGLEAAIHRGLSFAPYADILWFETSEPNLKEAEQFAKAIHAKFPGKWLCYNCSPSFNWKKKLDEMTITKFRNSLFELGFVYQFVTLAGFHSLNYGMFNLARKYKETGMLAYANFQNDEFQAENLGYRATAHQRFVGTGYFDLVAQAVAGDGISTKALEGSTEEAQFSMSG